MMEPAEVIPPGEAPLVSVLFVTYNRPTLLEQALRSFKENTNYTNVELIVTDDGSPASVQEFIRTLPFDKFVLGKRNRGLGANNNQGMYVASGKYILMIQDDRLCVGPADYLLNAVRLMELNSHIGIINFSGARHIPNAGVRLYGNEDGAYHIINPAPSEPSGYQYFLYTDMPHLMTRSAFDAIGLYSEDRDMERCEDDYMRRWAAQTEFVTVIHEMQHDSVFIDIGQEHSFRSTRLRYRVDKMFMPLGKRMKTLSPQFYGVARYLVRFPIRVLERLHIIR